MTSTDDLTSLDALTQAELVRTKQVKPIELVDAAIERIERLNPAINAVVTEMFDSARQDRLRVDTRWPVRRRSVPDERLPRRVRRRAFHGELALSQGLRPRSRQ